MSDAVVSLGTFFEIDIAQTGDWLVVAEVKTIGGPSTDKQIHDVTHLLSPNYWREFLGGLKDSGNLTLNVNWITTDASHEVVWDAFDKLPTAGDPQAKQNFRLTYSTGEAQEFEGYVQNISPNADREAPYEATITVKITGPLTHPA